MANSLRHREELALKDWSFRARISHENTISRRFSAFKLRSFKEESTSLSFRSNITISSTASSPGYTLTDKEEIDPSTYSFTTALKALQAKTMMQTWECLDGVSLNSKWEEAEKYICNPLSGKFPVECLSAKTLSARSFHSSRIMMSAPLVYPSQLQGKLLANSPINKRETQVQLMTHVKKRGEARDVGTQSTPVKPFPNESVSRPPFDEKPARVDEYVKESPRSEDLGSRTQEKGVLQVELKETRQKGAKLPRSKCSGKWGCLSLSILWRRANKVKPNSKTTTLSFTTPMAAPVKKEHCMN